MSSLSSSVKAEREAESLLFQLVNHGFVHGKLASHVLEWARTMRRYETIKDSFRNKDDLKIYLLKNSITISNPAVWKDHIQKKMSSSLLLLLEEKKEKTTFDEFLDVLLRIAIEYDQGQPEMTQEDLAFVAQSLNRDQEKLQQYFHSTQKGEDIFMGQPNVLYLDDGGDNDDGDNDDGDRGGDGEFLDNDDDEDDSSIQDDHWFCEISESEIDENSLKVYPLVSSSGVKKFFRRPSLKKELFDSLSFDDQKAWNNISDIGKYIIIRAFKEPTAEGWNLIKISKM